MEDSPIPQTCQTLLERMDAGMAVDAVFCFNDYHALELMRQLHARGMRVPEDIAIVGYDNIDLCAAASPPLTSVVYKTCLLYTSRCV